MTFHFSHTSKLIFSSHILVLVYVIFLYLKLYFSAFFFSVAHCWGFGLGDITGVKKDTNSQAIGGFTASKQRSTVNSAGEDIQYTTVGDNHIFNFAGRQPTTFSCLIQEFTLQQR